MNRLRGHKYRTNTDAIPAAGDNVPGSSPHSSSASPITSGGLLNKISKRYSTLSSKITRRNQSGRKGHSPQKTISGSYDMTGSLSEDHRLEIGAPILISTTTLDADRFDISEERLRQIGGGIAATNHAAVHVQTINHSTSPQIPSSSSENEDFVDALNVTPQVDYHTDEEKYESALETPRHNNSECKKMNNTDTLSPIRKATPTNNDDNRNSSDSSVSPTTPLNQLSNYYESKRAVNHPKPTFGRKSHSKSAQNLHRSELKVFLQRAPSMELDMSLTTAKLDHCKDLPMLPELYDASKCSSSTTDNDDNDADKENSSPSIIMSPPTTHSKSDPNTPFGADQKVNGYLSQQQLFKSVDSLDLHRNSRRRSIACASSSNSVNQNGSKQSLDSHNSTIAEFDMKSVSCQSLNAQTLFVSIDELNEITRQINESEEFNQDIDLEYCTHRDNLKPSERRITLLKNKNSRLISFNNNKEKIKKGWSGVKHWIGEESLKLKEAVQKQTAMTRSGTTSRLNLSNAECRQSPSVHGSVMLQSAATERGLNSSRSKTTSTISLQQSVQQPISPPNNFEVSCDNIAEESQLDEVDEVESSFTALPGDDDSPASKRIKREGQNGFEELRRYVKQGGDFSKELIIILQERVDSELLYSKSLSKMATKLNKACRELPGSIAEAWRGVATEMESRSEIHRQLSTSLTEEIVKPLKVIADAHHKTRKSVETNVDKSSRVLTEWRVSEGKAKKSSHTAARENEKLQDAMLDVRIQKSPSIAILHQSNNKLAAEKEIKSAEKDCAKLDNKRKKAEEAVKRADVEYYTLCVRAERARVDWEMAVLRSSSVLQNIENQRLVNMKNFVSNYTRLVSNMNPILDGLMQRLQPQVDACNVVKDMQVVKNIRRNSEGPSEQLLPDFYCEHTTLAMNRERRKHALIKLLQLVKTDLERERRSRNGLKGLSQSLNNQENQNITDKLYHIRSMLTYLEGARFKLHSALLELDHKPRTSHPLAQHIQVTRDRTGLQQSILKVPLWLKNNERMTTNNADDSYRESDYDCVSKANTSGNHMTSHTEISKDLLIQSFNRSKSNIETYTNSSICLSNSDKLKTVPTNIDDPYSDRGQADGGSNQQDSDFDEFSSQEEEEEDDQQSPTLNGGRKDHKSNIEKSISSNGITTIDQHHHYQNSAEINEDRTKQNQVNGNSNGVSVILSRCKALYSYTPKLYDELELNPGDIIEVHAKQEDGWWLGALNNQVGIFPATYVEEFA